MPTYITYTYYKFYKVVLLKSLMLMIVYESFKIVMNFKQYLLVSN